jgi:hypothetical protein
MALTSEGTAKIIGTLTSAFDSKNVPAKFTFATTADAFASGTAIDQADLAWWDTARNLAATSETHDLAGGLTDPFGATITMARVKGLYIKNNSTTVGETLKIGGGSNPFLLFDNASDIYELGPNGIFFVWEPSAAALPVTASTGDLLKIDSGAATFTYDIVIIGASA